MCKDSNDTVAREPYLSTLLETLVLVLGPHVLKQEPDGLRKAANRPVSQDEGLAAFKSLFASGHASERVRGWLSNFIFAVGTLHALPISKVNNTSSVSKY